MYGYCQETTCNRQPGNPATGYFQQIFVTFATPATSKPGGLPCMQYITLWDFLLTPIFMLVLSAIARGQRNRRYPAGHPLRPYYMPALYLKFGGAIFIGMLYQYYYGGGDTFNFFEHTRVINTAFSKDFTAWLKLVTHQPVADNPDIYEYRTRLWWYNDTASYTVAAIGAVFGLLSGTAYLPIAVCFAYLSFTGVWAMFRTFASLYPTLHKQMAVAFLFIPSTFVWGSGVFKDTICMFGLGWLTYTVFRLFINRDFSLRNILLLALSFYLMWVVKKYIVVAFVPALAIWLLNTYSSRIRLAALRWLARLAFVGVAGAGFWLAAQVFAEELDSYSLEAIAETAQTTRGWLAYKTEVDGGSGYDLGAFDPSFGGMLRVFPQAVVVTLFRPFIWETRKVIVALSALEALLFLYFTIQAFRRRGIGNTLQLVGKDPNLLFFLIFSLIFAFAVGISSYNFGALSRYKIPCMPFYAAFLVVVLYQGKTGKQPLPQPRRRAVPFGSPPETKPV